MILVREERPSDLPAIRRVIERAFGQRAEADLVARLRSNGHANLSLVADRAGEIVGHVLFSPVRISDAPSFASGSSLLGLAPLAVDPSHQRRGMGSRLVRAGLARLQRLGFAGVVLLGSPAYYGRFGFEAASLRALRSIYDSEHPGAFQAVELRLGGLRGVSGLVEYGPEFAITTTHAVVQTKSYGTPRPTNEADVWTRGM